MCRFNGVILKQIVKKKVWTTGWFWSKFSKKCHFFVKIVEKKFDIFFVIFLKKNLTKILRFWKFQKIEKNWKCPVQAVENHTYFFELPIRNRKNFEKIFFWKKSKVLFLCGFSYRLISIFWFFSKIGNFFMSRTPPKNESWNRYSIIR